jgi:hypothetical protein
LRCLFAFLEVKTRNGDFSPTTRSTPVNVFTFIDLPI